ncbi:MAG TPA: toll/interleukin-1 receptor domain-containing protein [Steroidobacteraceae bacterium]|nr:toll/interleukin-1 receptor domain-containing protein [Steroidobacteraceae bacterium]
MAEPQEQYRYWAFISYSNKDALVARRLHRRLENYSIPRDLRGRPGLDGAVPAKLFPIFRDREELPLSSDLGASIEDALRISRYLIVLCSPAAAHSRWVNEEIRYFKSLGREDRIFAIILSGEPNASDVPATSEQECFPPALRHRVDNHGQISEQRTEPIAGDLRPGGDGWHRVFLKSVAGITGMGFDAFARRERKRRLRRQAAAGIAALVVLTAGAWWLDYNRLKVSYYETFATRWGVPVGIVPVDPQQPAGYEFYYRFESRRGRLRAVRYVDREGNARGEDFNNNVAIREIHYREDGSVRELVQFQRNNKLIRRAVYSNIRRTPNGDAIQYVDFHQENQDAPLALANEAVADIGNPFGASRSEITGQQITYDSSGRPKSITNLNAYHQKRANSAGVFGVRYEYRGSSLVSSATENLGFDGKPTPSRIGVLRSEYSRDLAHGSYEWRYFGANRQPVVERGGYHLVRHVYDSGSDRTEDSYFGTDGKPVLLADGYHKFVTTFDRKRLHTEWTYFGVDGEPVFSKAGYHRVELTYDTDGNLIDFAYFGIDGKPVYSNAGFHRQRASYDRHGNQLETTCFGIDDRPTLNKQGYYRATQAVDRRGNVTDIAYFGTKGEAVVGNFGVQAYHRIRQLFDDGDNLVDVRYFDVGDRPSPPNADTFNHVHREFDERSNLVSASLYNGDDPVASYNFGLHSFTATFDQRGNPTEWALFGVDGKPVLSPGLRIHRLMQKFDERGRATEESSWGVSGEPAVNFEGYHRKASVYDERSNLREVTFFGTHGEPASNPDGCHHAISEYDEVGRAIAAECFGVDGKPILDNQGYHRVVDTYDRHRNQTSEAYFGVQGQPINGRAGYHRVARTFNDRSDYLEEAYFGPDDKPMAIAAGYHRLQRVLNERGWEVGVQYFGVHGEPSLNGDGIHRVAKSYDARGREVSEAYFGLQGEPAMNHKGYQRAAMEYFADYPQVSKITYFDVTGKEMIAPGSRIANSLFGKCVVLLLPNGSLVLGIPIVLPKEDIVLYVEPTHLSFVVDRRILADILPQNAVVPGNVMTADQAFGRLMTLTKVPIVEFTPGGAVPTAITRTLDIRRGPPPGLH